jgi:alpha-tubulin suppressor-like RCC1 family protein
MIQTPSAPSRRGRVLLIAMAGLAVVVALPLFSPRPSAVWALELGAHRQSRALPAFNGLRPPAASFAWDWGAEQGGQLGNGIDLPDAALPTPTLVLNLTEVTAIGAGGGHSLAARRDGTVWSWGLNFYGALGDGTSFNSAVPVQVLNPADGTPFNGVTAVAARDYNSLVLKNDGTVWDWGTNGLGQLGIGTTSMFSNVPVQVLYLSGVTAIACGGYYNLARTSDGTVWAWGWNYYGQLGNGTTFDSFTPVQVLNPNGTPFSGVTAIAAGGGGSSAHSLALANDGTVWAWGNNEHGQLGDGTTTERHTPVQVLNPDGTPFSGIRAIAAGYDHSVAVKNDGTVWAWGHNDHKQLGVGDGTITESHTPVQLLNPDGTPFSGIATVAAGVWHSLALKSDTTVWAWGFNYNGQLGDGTTTDRDKPVQVLSLGGTSFGVVAAIAAGGNTSLAMVKVLPQKVEPPSLAINTLLAHPANRFRPPLFNLQIDGATVRANVTSGSTGLLEVSPGNHMVSETAGTDTDLDGFTAVIGFDCASDGTVSLVPGDKKVCTITNYDHFGGCGRGQCCRQPGEGTQPCKVCALSGNC